MASFVLPAYMLFVFFILRQDTKEQGPFPSTLWVPFVWLALSVSRPISAWIYPGRALTQSDLSDYIHGSPIDQAFLATMICIGLMVLYRRRHLFSISFQDNIWLFLLYLYALISISWSSSPDVSGKRWIKAIGDVIMALVLLTEDHHAKAIERILRRCAIIMIPLSIILIIFYRNYGVLYNRHGTPFWAGVTQGKNELGLLCAVLAVFLFWRFQKYWPKISAVDGVLFFVNLYLLRGAHSATANVVMIVSIILLLAIRQLKGNQQKLRKLVIAALILVVIMQGLSITMLNKSLDSAFFSATGRDASFTGRVPFWAYLIKIGVRNPITGAGYGAFWISNMNEVAVLYPWRPTNGHNGYLDVFLDLGLIGLFLLVFLILHTTRKATRSLAGSETIGRLLFAFILILLTNNFTESRIMRPIDYCWFFFLVSSVVIAMKPKNHDAQYLKIGTPVS